MVCQKWNCLKSEKLVICSSDSFGEKKKQLTKVDATLEKCHQKGMSGQTHVRQLLLGRARRT